MATKSGQDSSTSIEVEHARVTSKPTLTGEQIGELYYQGYSEWEVSKYRAVYRSQSTKQHIQVTDAYNRYCDAVGIPQYRIIWVGRHTDEHHDATSSAFEWLRVLRPFLRPYSETEEVEATLDFSSILHDKLEVPSSPRLEDGYVEVPLKLQTRTGHQGTPVKAVHDIPSAERKLSSADITEESPLQMSSDGRTVSITSTQKKIESDLVLQVESTQNQSCVVDMRGTTFGGDVKISVTAS